jgi:hypothetical protein
VTDNTGDPPASDPIAPPPANDPAPVDDFAPLPRRRILRGGGRLRPTVDRWWQDPEDTTEEAEDTGPEG